MPDIITDRKITQQEAGQLMAPMELDLLALFKVMEQYIITGMEDFEGTPEEYIDEVLKNLSGVGEIGEMAVLKSMCDDLNSILEKGKPLPVGTRRQRSDGIYVKQPDGTWLKETEENGKQKELLSKKTKEWINKIDKIKEGNTLRINSSTYIKHGYHEFNKYELYTFNGKIIETFPNSKILSKKLSGEIKGIEFKKPKDTGKQINIVDLYESGYKGQDMKWTETFDHSEVLKTDMIAYHYSDNPIKNFGIKETCFFPDPYDYTDIGYQIIIPAGTKIKWYKSGELRVEINKSMKITQLKKGWSEYEEIK